MIELWEHQKEAVSRLKSGKVLIGNTGSGKSLTALAYAGRCIGGSSKIPLYVITTAKKRDTGDWEREASKLSIEITKVDSWNNIKNYSNISKSFFIFDEQRVIGSGVWARKFIRIAKRNHWILLSATPADTWTDLIPVFIANRFYKNRTQFLSEHVIFAPYVKYPKIVGYKDIEKLKYLRDTIYVRMKETKRRTDIFVYRYKAPFNEKLLKKSLAKEWNPFTNRPIANHPEAVQVARRIINSNPIRCLFIESVLLNKKKVIVFYNYNYELDILKRHFKDKTSVAEYNGNKHQPIPDTETWLYLVQYLAGSEAWECFETDTMVFYSLNYSYRIMKQSMGRIDRRNTKFSNLYYYKLTSDSFMDLAIEQALKKKKKFNMNDVKNHMDKYIGNI